MAKKGELLYAWTTDAALGEKAECGGAVSQLLKFALESKMVDAVLAVKKGVDLYDAVPTLVSNPKDIPLDDLRIGMPVQAVFERAAPDQPPLQFVAAGESGR